MRVTKYNKRITIRKRIKVYNEIGGWKNTWANYYTSWASVLPVTGLKRLEYGRLAYTEVYEVEMRKRTINPGGDCQVFYEEREFQIHSLTIGHKTVKMDISR